jgi:hypothetical protein
VVAAVRARLERLPQRVRLPLTLTLTLTLALTLTLTLTLTLALALTLILALALTLTLAPTLALSLALTRCGGYVIAGEQSCYINSYEPLMLVMVPCLGLGLGVG